MTKTFEIANLKCGGCASTIKKSLAEKFGNIEVDVEGKKVTVDIQNEEDEEVLKATLHSLGYPFVTDKLSFIENNRLKAKSLVSCTIGKLSLTKNN